MQCDFCGGPRLNGAPLEKDGNGGWQMNRGAANPARQDLKFACRSCMRKKFVQRAHS